ncbi:MAG: gliding motility-associated C-terminal domain-containing protein [Bacteroidota bacterium]
MVHVLAQCTVVATHDTVICKGAGVQLSAWAQFANAYSWAPAAGLNQTYVNNPVAHPSVSTQYVVSAYTVLDSNLIVNGDFDAGNTGFSSNYTYNAVSVWNEATYAVNSNPNAVHPNFASCTDHTTGTGMMMIVNGAAAANVNIWCETITVIPNTDYAFSTWLASVIVEQPAILQFSINGITLGSPFVASSTLCQWQQFYELWNSGTSTTATICIVNQNTATSGNDFVLDDISFQQFCVATDTVNVIIDQVPADAGLDTLICKGTLTNLSGHGGVAYHWSTGANTQILNVNLSSPAVFTVSVTDSYGCKGEDSVHVGILQLPTAEAGPDQWVCPGQSAVLQASGGATYAWDNGVITQSQSITPPANSVFHVIVTDSNHCSSVDSMIVFVYSNPMLSLGPDLVACSGDTVVLHASGAGHYLWSTGDTSFYIKFIPHQSGEYWVQVTDPHGCIASDTMQLTVGVHPLTKINYGDTLLCTGTTTNLSGSGALYYHWFPSEGLSDTLSSSITASPESTTIYYCVGFNAAACRDTANITLVVSDCSVNIPNVFTPNGDGKNDVFVIEYIGFEDYHLKIFNRWGKRIFESSRKEDLWDGTINGTPASDGVYYYFLMVGNREYKGTLTVFR